MRGGTEVVVVVQREGEYLVLRRAPERLGYWSLVAGEVEPGETPAVAARRELWEEARLDAEVVELPAALSYSLLDDPPTVRARYAPGVESVTVHPYRAEASPGWEPVLDAEHDTYRWCNAEDAVRLLGYETLKDALRAAERTVAS